ncbi:gamma-glutamyl-phosphate reductase [Gammaproteobacteria bacterium]|nr:gamma-glutamyl-phosphate reductase [Gammaproteobacteria bacterium]
MNKSSEQRAQLNDYITTLGKNAKAAAFVLGNISSLRKNTILLSLKSKILTHKDILVSANLKDIENYQKKYNDNDNDDDDKQDLAFVDRLRLSAQVIDSMAEGLSQIASLPDPIGQLFDINPMPSGISVGRMRVPLGVVGIIYEARPNVTIDATALCLKSGNAVILRGGSESFHTNQALAKLITESLVEADFPEHCVQIINTIDRDAVGLMLKLKDYIDVIIPRGGNSLVARINAESTIPVIKHLDGICHTFVDRDANLEMALNICDNAKTQRYAPCNTMETLLIDALIAPDFLPKIATIYAQKNVEMRVCEQAHIILSNYKLKHKNITWIAATDADWRTEYLAPIISIKIVADMNAAITHINHYGSHHTDVIITNAHAKALQFLRLVDSASVMINASSRFTDGFEFGLGAEIGISTDKLHARGPVGLEGLCSVKYVVFGDGQIRT